MTREEFKVIVKAMLAAYPQNCPVKTQDVFELWYSMLRDLQYTTVSERLKNHIRMHKFAPSISELRGVNEERKGSFYNFSRRQYNIDELERELLKVNRCAGIAGENGGCGIEQKFQTGESHRTEKQAKDSCG